MDMDNKNVTVHELMAEVSKTFTELFSRTPLRLRLEDISKEAGELERAIDWRQLKEESGDLGASLLAFFAECELDPVSAIRNSLLKIKLQESQYKSLGRKTKVALLGGAFNHPTRAHIDVAKLVLKFSKEFDEVWLVPCARHMYNKKMASSEDRLEMCRLAALEDDRIKVSDYEIANNLAGETYNFMKRLMEDDLAKNHNFSMIIGMDNANTFHRWVNYVDLEKLVRFVVVPRSGQTVP